MEASSLLAEEQKRSWEEPQVSPLRPLPGHAAVKGSQGTGQCYREMWHHRSSHRTPSAEASDSAERRELTMSTEEGKRGTGPARRSNGWVTAAGNRGHTQGCWWACGDSRQSRAGRRAESPS